MKKTGINSITNEETSHENFLFQKHDWTRRTEPVVLLEEPVCSGGPGQLPSTVGPDTCAHPLARPPNLTPSLDAAPGTLAQSEVTGQGLHNAHTPPLNENFPIPIPALPPTSAKTLVT